MQSIKDCLTKAFVFLAHRVWPIASRIIPELREEAKLLHDHPLTMLNSMMRDSELLRSDFNNDQKVPFPSPLPRCDAFMNNRGTGEDRNRLGLDRYDIVESEDWVLNPDINVVWIWPAEEMIRPSYDPKPNDGDFEPFRPQEELNEFFGRLDDICATLKRNVPGCGIVIGPPALHYGKLTESQRNVFSSLIRLTLRIPRYHNLRLIFVPNLWDKVNPYWIHGLTPQYQGFSAVHHGCQDSAFWRTWQN